MATPIAQREIDQIIERINQLEGSLLVKRAGRIELTSPVVIANTLPQLAIILQQAVDPMTQIELDYRRAKAERFDRFIKEGMKKSPAIDQLKFEQDLLEMEAAVNRINNFVKLTQSTISTLQSNIRVQTGMATNNL